MPVLLTLAIVVGCFISLMSFISLKQFRWDKGGLQLWVIKSFTNALAPFLSLTGVLIAMVGIATGSLVAILLGSYSAFIFYYYLSRISTEPVFSRGFVKTFGTDWQKVIPAEWKNKFLKRPGVLFLPPCEDYSFEQNIAFCTLPGTDRKLFCDLWKPSKKVPSSGLAFIYLHGSAWYLLDKDAGTRIFFRHLASQGHLVMDVAYRLFPEASMSGMVEDAKRAISWMKDNATLYAVDPDKIVIGGGSAGGHIALLAAFLPEDRELNPPELANADLRVSAVVSFYGPPDLAALYYHTGQQFTTRIQPGKPKKKVSRELPGWVKKKMGADYHRLGYDKPMADSGALGKILGCHPDECPDLYTYFSPLTHVNGSCPPTLIIQGEHDMFTPVNKSRELYQKLSEAEVPAVMHLLPQTDHAFDLFVPKYSAVAHTAFYTVERFLAVIALKDRNKKDAHSKRPFVEATIENYNNK